MRKNDLGIWALAGIIVTVVMAVVAFPVMLIRGFVLMKLWNWFVLGNLTNFNMGCGLSLVELVLHFHS